MPTILRSCCLFLCLFAAPAAMGQEAAPDASEPTTGEQMPVEAAASDTDTAEEPAGDAAEATSPGAASVKRDVVLVIDNSGSMRENDPQSLAPAAVEAFIQGLDTTNRVALLIFDQDVTVAQDFVNIAEGRQQLLDSLGAIDYSGQYTDSPAAIERAIYTLKHNARADARRIIIFMTDGIVDTGNPEDDRSRTEWLRTDLATAAARADIQIFGIAFTNDADFQLIQSLANKTEGDYFRALAPADLGNVFERINEVIVREAQPEPEPEAQAPAPPAQPVVQTPPEPIVIEVPSKPQPPSREEQTRHLILISAAAVVCLTLLAILIVLIKRGRSSMPPDEAHEPNAYLSDIHGVTEQQSYQLSRKPTMLGRVAGTDSDHLAYIVIPETTVGRRHALIEYKDYAYWIIDQGSINGTYVNDHMVTTETRLKHGDRIRLHKFEFEFVMPEMFDSGMTVVSNTVYARDIAADKGVAAADVAAAAQQAGQGDDTDTSGNLDDFFDISGDDDSSPSGGRITLSEENYDGDDEDETIQHDDQQNNAAAPEQSETDADEDVTLTPGMDRIDDDDEDATMRHMRGNKDENDDSDEWYADGDDNNDDRRHD